MIETLRWRNGNLEVLDQVILPFDLKYIECKTSKDVIRVIKKMNIRGAPAIGIAGAYGVYLGLRNLKAKKTSVFFEALRQTVKGIASTRPTARNLFWGLERMEKTAIKSKGQGIDQIKEVLLQEAHKILEEDKKICRRLGKNGSSFIKKGSAILTHCNAGALATADYGTALGVIYASKNKIKKVYIDETRPVLQGARLTAWELGRAGIGCTLICDNMAASLMKKGDIDAIIVGADRIAANGDTANKIGTYNLAVLAKHHRLPFYVAAPVSTFDLSVKEGKYIPIEERSGDEVRKIGNKYIVPKTVKVYNPAFDVTPAGFITAIITEKGVIRNPNRKRVAACCG